MKLTTRMPKKLIKAAARLRAAGWSWKLIGEKLGRSEGTCSRWMTRYSAIWSRAYLQAEAALLKDAGSEARVVLQRLMRSTDERLQCAAARLLFQARINERRLERQTARAAKNAPLSISGVQSVDEMLHAFIDSASEAPPVDRAAS